MNLFTLYARREPSTDPVLKTYAPGSKRNDVVFYRDAACTRPYGRWAWHVSPAPNRRRRSIVLNCFRWAVVWV